MNHWSVARYHSFFLCFQFNPDSLKTKRKKTLAAPAASSVLSISISLTRVDILPTIIEDELSISSCQVEAPLPSYVETVGGGTACGAEVASVGDDVPAADPADHSTIY